MRKIGLILLFYFLITSLVLIIIEGSFSWFYFLRSVRNARKVTEEIHTQYDPLLGWINKQNAFFPDMYGKGVYLTTDKNRFRKTPINSSPDHFNTICTGDSFVLGYGVNDNQTWCALLSRGNIQTFNMGQGGYGIDQNYLWYKRDAANIPHAFHIMAFIMYDFDRALSDDFFGYGKPFFEIRNNELTNVNYPAPRLNKLKRFMLLNEEAFNTLSLYRAITHAKNRIANLAALTNSKINNSNQKDIPITIFENLIKLTTSRGAVPIVVLLPSKYETDNKTSYMEQYNKQKQSLEDLAKNDKYIFIDMGAYMFDVSQEEYDSLFIKSNGHYTVDASKRVAEQISNVISEYIANHPTLKH